MSVFFYVKKCWQHLSPTLDIIEPLKERECSVQKQEGLTIKEEAASRKQLRHREAPISLSSKC